MADILNSTILDSAILVFPLKLTHTCQDWSPPFAQKNFHSFILTQLDDGSHLEFYHVGFRHCHLGFRHLLIFSQIHSKTLSLHSDQTNSIWLTWWWLPSWILPSWIQPFCTKLWLKLIQSDSNSFILTQLDDGSHLQFGPLGFSHLSFSSQTHLHLPDWFPPFAQERLHFTLPSPPFAQKNFTHSFWLNLMMAAILNSTMLDWDTLFSSLRFTQNTLTSLWLWLKLMINWLKRIHYHSLDDGCHVGFRHSWIWLSLRFSSKLSSPSHSDSDLTRVIPTICTKKTVTHSFWLNLMMASILNSTMLDSDTAILDSDTF